MALTNFSIAADAGQRDHDRIVDMSDRSSAFDLDELEHAPAVNGVLLVELLIRHVEVSSLLSLFLFLSRFGHIFCG